MHAGELGGSWGWKIIVLLSKSNIWRGERGQMRCRNVRSKVGGGFRIEILESPGLSNGGVEKINEVRGVGFGGIRNRTKSMQKSGKHEIDHFWGRHDSVWPGIRPNHTQPSPGSPGATSESKNNKTLGKNLRAGPEMFPWENLKFSYVFKSCRFRLHPSLPPQQPDPTPHHARLSWRLWSETLRIE